MAEAMMCHYSNNVLTAGYSRNTKTTIHWILNSIAIILAIWGILDKVIHKYQKNAQHFVTPHAILGKVAK